MHDLLREIRACKVCASVLPLGCRPVLRAQSQARIMIIGQAPGTKVHESGIPWDDASGKRLRQWMGIDNEVFYNEQQVAIVPMGFCYPGKGTSGDFPPRLECAPLWHKKIWDQLPDIQLTLLIGKYAQQYYLKDRMRKTLTETVRDYQNYLPEFLPLPHPSPRNQLWLKKNEWFSEEILPELKNKVHQFLSAGS